MINFCECGKRISVFEEKCRECLNPKIKLRKRKLSPERSGKSYAEYLSEAKGKHYDFYKKGLHVENNGLKYRNPMNGLFTININKKKKKKKI